MYIKLVNPTNFPCIKYVFWRIVALCKLMLNFHINGLYTLDVMANEEIIDEPNIHGVFIDILLPLFFERAYTQFKHTGWCWWTTYLKYKWKMHVWIRNDVKLMQYMKHSRYNYINILCEEMTQYFNLVKQ